MGARMVRVHKPNQCDRQAHERRERPLTMHGSEQNGTEEYGSSSEVICLVVL